ncbi:MAG: hypothetical protein IPH12_19325 [Saprospirales bacterium]|nr:hypothetical protein [Saprospirales bacterium]
MIATNFYSRKQLSKTRIAPFTYPFSGISQFVWVVGYLAPAYGISFDA